MIAATGFFDGVHKGHRKVLETVSTIASEKKEESAVITFWPHPRTVLQQDAGDLRLLNTIEEKKRLIESAGIDRTIVIPFTRQFSALSTEEFLKQYLIDKYGVSTLVIGYDHRLGKNVNQSQQDMIAIANGLGLEVVRCNEFIMDGDIISSTKIRNLLSNGSVKRANEFLGYVYMLGGVVLRGNGLGKGLGFPTANIGLYNPLKAVPQDGVYAVKVKVLDQWKQGICNIGLRPTLTDSSNRVIETHILDFSEEIYGLDLEIHFLEKLRPECKFSSRAELVEQMCADTEKARRIISSL